MLFLSLIRFANGMEELVELYQGKEARIRTWDIWQGFGYKKHGDLKRVITRNKGRFEEKGGVFMGSVKPINKGKGRPDESYLLNERQFILLILLAKNTPQSIQLKDRIESEFFRMRKMLAQMASTRSSEEWQHIRKDGKAIYHLKSDVIKQFIDYSTAQGSKSANMYYSNLAKMENKALFLIEQKYPNVREVLNIKQLMQVATADQIVEKALDDGMKQELPYKDIYVLAKERVIKFSEILGKSMVIEMLETPQLEQDV